MLCSLIARGSHTVSQATTRFALEERILQNAVVLEVFRISHRKVSFLSLHLSQNCALYLYFVRTHSYFIDSPVTTIWSS